MLKQICQSLFSELKVLQNDDDNKYSSDDVDVFAPLIYQKFFESKVFENHSRTDDDIKALLETQTNQCEEIVSSDDDVWIFGYGSLVWKADFPFIDRRRGFITGYQRHFFQHSIDHRGIPTKPGRVVTLVPTHDPQDRVYGMAYRIASKHKDDVLRHLDYREKNGYERCLLRFYEFPESTDINFDVIMYIATADNESYAGHICDLSSIADQIFTSAGPSGPNREYLFHLAKAMRMLFPGVNDTHLFDLESAVLERINCVEPVMLKKALLEEIKSILMDKLRMVNEENHNNDECVKKAVKEFECLKLRCEKAGWKEAILARVYLSQKAS